MQIFVNTEIADGANGVKDKFVNLGQGYIGVLQLFQLYCNLKLCQKKKLQTYKEI